MRPIASLTKMMTALLVLESGADLNESIPIPDSLTPEFQAIRANRGHTIGLQAGESVRRLDMLYAMLVPSANDAASVLASDAAGGDLAAFSARMNARASQLGCTNTHFTCPHGLYDHNNYSTARDMAKIALACHANGTYMQVANTVSYTLPATNIHPARNISSTNRLLKPGSAYYRGYAQGMKTGFTPGGPLLCHLCQPERPDLRPCHLRLQQPEYLPGSRRAVRLGILKPRPAAQGGGPRNQKALALLVLAEPAGMI